MAYILIITLVLGLFMYLWTPSAKSQEPRTWPHPVHVGGARVADRNRAVDGGTPSLKGTSMSDRNVIEQTEFTCPRCGGHEWGTYFEDGAFNPADINAANGLCHGMVISARGGFVCRFTWPRRDDAKYFRPTGHFYPLICVGTVP